MEVEHSKQAPINNRYAEAHGGLEDPVEGLWRGEGLVSYGVHMSSVPILTHGTPHSTIQDFRKFGTRDC